MATLLQNKIRAFTIFVGFLLIGLALVTKSFSDDVTVDEFISIFVFSKKGILLVDQFVIYRVLTYCLVLPLLFTTSFFYIEEFVSNLFLVKHKMIVPSLLFVCGIYSVVHVFNVKDYITFLYSGSHETDYFAQYYQNPGDVHFEEKKPKNLILIYVEGLETTYANEKIFGRNLLSKLDNLTVRHVSFEKFKQMPGTGWSIAGLVSSQCGVPLQLLPPSAMFHLKQGFLSNATCLSDILASHGYQNVFMKGAALAFAGTDIFLKSHHYQTMYDKQDWLRLGIPEDQMIGWGLPDDLLFKEAKLILERLVAKNKPFNLTIFTVDTHGIEGQLNQTCRRGGGQSFDDIVECTANEVADFIHFIEKRGWFKTSTIIVMGDHLAMKNSVSDKLQLSPGRYIFNLILSERQLYKNTDTIVHYDMLPTILTSLGFIFEGNKLGLGYKAVSFLASSALPSKRISEISKISMHSSPTYQMLWENIEK